jgi:hypothetical protein
MAVDILAVLYQWHFSTDIALVRGLENSNHLVRKKYALGRRIGSENISVHCYGTGIRVLVVGWDTLELQKSDNWLNVKTECGILCFEYVKRSRQKENLKKYDSWADADRLLYTWELSKSYNWLNIKTFVLIWQYKRSTAYLAVICQWYISTEY